jgi:hypothetical protein
MTDTKKQIKIFYVNLGLDTFDTITNVIANDTSNKYKTCMDNYAATQSVCEDKPNTNKIVSNFKSLDPTNVNTFFACNPFTFMPYITATSEHLLTDIIKANIDLFVAGEMCKFDYESNYNLKFSKNTIKEYSRKSANDSYLLKQKVPGPPQSNQDQGRGRGKNQGRGRGQNQGQGRGQGRPQVAYQVKGSTDLPVIDTDIDATLLSSMTMIGYENERKNINKTKFADITASSKKVFFVGQNSDTNANNTMEQITCDNSICDELQIVKTIIKGKKYIVINIHNRTYASNFHQYTGLFIDFIKGITNRFEDYNIVIIGDFNIGKKDSDILKSASKTQTDNQPSNSDVIKFINEMKKHNFINASVLNAYSSYENSCNGIKKVSSKNANIMVFHKILYDADIVIDSLDYCDITLVTSSHYPIILTITEKPQINTQNQNKPAQSTIPVQQSRPNQSQQTTPYQQSRPNQSQQTTPYQQSRPNQPQRRTSVQQTTPYQQSRPNQPQQIMPVQSRPNQSTQYQQPRPNQYQQKMPVQSRPNQSTQSQQPRPNQYVKNSYNENKENYKILKSMGDR